MAETVHTGRLIVGRLTGTYCDTHPGCKSVGSRDETAHRCVDMMAIIEITKG